MAARKSTGPKGTVICVEDHDCKSFGLVPEGSLWDADNDVVTSNPSAFEQAPEPSTDDTEAVTADAVAVSADLVEG